MYVLLLHLYLAHNPLYVASQLVALEMIMMEQNQTYDFMTDKLLE